MNELLSSSIRNSLKNLKFSDDHEAINSCLKEICFSMLAADVDCQLVKQFRNGMKQELGFLPDVNQKKGMKRVLFNELCKLFDSGVKSYRPVKGYHNVIQLFGLQGSGKTTTATKYARFYKKKGFRCAIVCTDTFHTGSFDSLRSCTSYSIPYYRDYHELDRVKIAKAGVEAFKKGNYDLIIVDTSGRRAIELELLYEEMKLISDAIKPDEVMFVLDSSAGQSVRETVDEFKSKVPNGSIILTKLDCHQKGAGALSTIASSKSSISFLVTGEYIDSFEQFNVESFVTKLLGLGNATILPSLLELQRYSFANCTLRDFKQQLTGILNQGAISLLTMVPGFSRMEMYSDQEMTLMIKKYLTIMNSMNETEMDCSDISKLPNLKSRINRIARGSGKSSKDVIELINNTKHYTRISIHPPNFKNVKFTENITRMGNIDWNQIMRQMQHPFGTFGKGNGPQPKTN